MASFLYAGETVEITNSTVTFDQTTVVTPTELGDGTVTVEIVDVNFTVVIATTDMTWDDTQNLWVYLWDTTSTVANLNSPYQAKVIVTAENGTTSFDYLKISLKAPTF